LIGLERFAVALVGWLVTDQTLIYATGGLAYGQVSVSGNLNVSASAVAFGDTFGPGISALDASKTNAGFTAGAA
jgi:opacity protein-like surface antigen